MILYHAADLLWGSRIRAAAQAAGIPARPVRTPEHLAPRPAEPPARALLVDLDDPETALALIAHLRGPAATAADRAVRILAYGPHTHAEAFQAARDAGADQAMARGALAARLDATLRHLATDPQ